MCAVMRFGARVVALVLGMSAGRARLARRLVAKLGERVLRRMLDCSYSPEKHLKATAQSSVG